MEEITTGGLDWLFRIGTGGGFVALLWITIKFFGSSQSEAVSAYADLYNVVKQERDQFSADLAALRVEIAALRLELEDERKARAGLERELAQMGTSAAYLIKRASEE